ncbi:tetratricopeptide repeat protein, partial [Planktothrix sp.]
MESWKYSLEQANSYCKLQQWSKAMAAYQKALELNPNLPGIHQKIGDIL